MKNREILFLLSLPALAVFLSGCAASRPVTDTALGAGGAYAGYELSGGSPVGAVAGAAGGVLLSEGGQYLARKEQSKSYQTGYEKGRSDAVKQQYWLQVKQQQVPPVDPNVLLYPIPVPEQTIDGAVFQPTTKYLRIEE
jgi:hypothetical protein